MAQTYTVNALGTAFASGKCLLSLFNAAGSGRVIRVYRMWILNNQTAAVAGVLTTLQIKRLTAASAGTACAPIKHDSTNESIPAQVTAATGTTVTATDIFRQLMWSNDEPAASTGSSDEFECIVPLNEIWNAGYGDSNVQPITLREGQGVALIHTGSSAVGISDVFFEFTMAAT